MNVQGIVECAMHMADGLITASKNNLGVSVSLNDVLEVWDNGCVALFSQLGEYAELCDALFREGFEQDKDVCGVYDYEVSYEFGGWFGTFVMTNGFAPPCEEAQAELRRLAGKFWAQADEPPVELKPVRDFDGEIVDRLLQRHYGIGIVDINWDGLDGDQPYEYVNRIAEKLDIQRIDTSVFEADHPIGLSDQNRAKAEVHHG